MEIPNMLVLPSEVEGNQGRSGHHRKDDDQLRQSMTAIFIPIIHPYPSIELPQGLHQILESVMSSSNVVAATAESTP
jgi:hypothetical protein